MSRRVGLRYRVRRDGWDADEIPVLPILVESETYHAVLQEGIARKANIAVVLLAPSEPTFLLSWTTPVYPTPSTPVTITAGTLRSTTSHPQGNVLTLTR